MSKTHHLAKTFDRMAEHHVAKSEHHARMSEHFSKLRDSISKAHDGDGHLSDMAEAIASEHSGMSAEHEEMASECQECAKALRSTSKAAGMGDDELEPVRVSAINPGPHLRAIPRAGGPELGKATIAPQFQSLVSLDQED